MSLLARNEGEDPTFYLMRRAYVEAYELHQQVRSTNKARKRTLLYLNAYEFLLLDAVRFYESHHRLFTQAEMLHEFDMRVDGIASNLHTPYIDFHENVIKDWERSTRPMEDDPQYIRTDRHYVMHMLFDPSYDDVFADKQFVTRRDGVLYYRDPERDILEPVPPECNVFYVKRELYLPEEVPARKGASLATLSKRALFTKPDAMTQSRWDAIPSYTNFFNSPHRN